MNQESVSLMFLCLFLAITVAAHLPAQNPAPVIVPADNSSPMDTTTPPISKEDTIRQQIAYHAKSLDGALYMKSKSESTQTDCSGVVYYSFTQSGLNLARLSAEGYHKLATPIRRQDLKPGDIITWESGGKIVHVQVFIGTAKETYGTSAEVVDDAVVNAPAPGKKVYIVSLRKFEQWNKSWNSYYGNLLQKMISQ